MNKIITAKHSPKNYCFADEGEELTLAPLESKKPKGIRKNEWFFIGKISGLPSRYGWVAEIDKDFDNQLKNPENYQQMLKTLYDSISKLLAGTPVISEWFEFGVMKKEKIFRVHKVFFY